jgi:hypothetical protein
VDDLFHYTFVNEIGWKDGFESQSRIMFHDDGWQE